MRNKNGSYYLSYKVIFKFGSVFCLFFVLLLKNNYIKPCLVSFVSLPVLLHEHYIDLEIDDERGYRFFPKSF